MRFLESKCVLVAVVVSGVIAASPIPASATTAPESTYFVRVTLTDRNMRLTRTRVAVGTLVVFIVRNEASRPRTIVVGSYRSGLPPRKQIEFELSFPVPWRFQIRSTGSHLPTLHARFVCA